LHTIDWSVAVEISDEMADVVERAVSKVYEKERFVSTGEAKRHKPFRGCFFSPHKFGELRDGRSI
jgi:hypothetical protein